MRAGADTTIRGKVGTAREIAEVKTHASIVEMIDNALPLATRKEAFLRKLGSSYVVFLNLGLSALKAARHKREQITAFDQVLTTMGDVSEKRGFFGQVGSVLAVVDAFVQCESRVENAQKVLRESNELDENDVHNRDEARKQLSMIANDLHEANAKLSTKDMEETLFQLNHSKLVEQAAIELAGAVADFPELSLRYPKAQLDEVLASGGDGAVLRSIELYDNREPMQGGRHDLFRATIDGEQVALKCFNIHTRKDQRAFMKEARRLRQLAHPHIVEVIIYFLISFLSKMYHFQNINDYIVECCFC